MKAEHLKKESLLQQERRQNIQDMSIEDILRIKNIKAEQVISQLEDQLGHHLDKHSPQKNQRKEAFLRK